ncbi:MAG: site-2 protease family protein [Thermoplasmata archaeon]|nr:site-2 protease family protein [Thermoplasmata archaeon]
MSIYIRPRFRFYPGELREIGIALLVLTISFFILISPLPFRLPSPMVALYYILISLTAVLTAFFVHEMSHKFIAIKFGYPAAFRKWNLGLIIALLSSFFGIIFAAPGAVYIYGYPSRRENGIISSAGPASNIIIGFIFLFLSFVTKNFIALLFFRYIAQLNFFLSFFNLLPIPPMDGLKVLTWRIEIYISLMILSIAGLAIGYMI